MRLPPAALALAAALAPLPAEPADPPGVVWEQTVEMEMGGMTMPPQTVRSCAPAGGLEQPPRSPNDDGSCRVTDVKKKGNRMTWKVSCADGAKGEGELTTSGDAYTGRMTFSSAEGAGSMKMQGRKVGGACAVGQPVGGEAQQQAMAMMQQQQQMQQAMMARELARQCQEAVKEMNVALFTMGEPYGCKDPAQVKAFCDRLGTADGLARLQAHGGASLDQAAAFCKADPEKLRASLCAEAARARDLATLGKSCPRETRELAQRECAGKESSNLSSEYRSFCLAYARDLLVEPKPKAPPSAEEAAKDKALEEGKKALKGLFGR